MSHRVLLSDREKRLLAGLVGQPLLAVNSDGWAVELHVGGDEEAIVIRVIPEEVATPSETHPHADVERPSFAVVEHVSGSESMRPIAPHLGVITEVFKARTFAVFTSPMEVGPTELLGVEIPAGIEYSLVFYPPSLASEQRNLNVDVELDVGVDIYTDLERRVTLFTEGIGFFVHVTVDEEPEASWGGNAELAALHDHP